MPACSKTAPSRSTRRSPPPPSGRCQVSRRKRRAAVGRLERDGDAVVQVAQVGDDGASMACWHSWCVTERSSGTLTRLAADLSRKRERRSVLRRHRAFFVAPSPSPSSSRPPSSSAPPVFAAAFFGVGRLASPPRSSRLRRPSSRPSPGALRPQRAPRAGAAAISAWHSSSVSDFGSRSFGILPFFAAVGDVRAVAAVQHLDAGLREVPDDAVRLDLDLLRG